MIFLISNWPFFLKFHNHLFIHFCAQSCLLVPWYLYVPVLIVYLLCRLFSVSVKAHFLSKTPYTFAWAFSISTWIDHNLVQSVTVDLPTCNNLLIQACKAACYLLKFGNNSMQYASRSILTLMFKMSGMSAAKVCFISDVLLYPLPSVPVPN